MSTKKVLAAAGALALGLTPAATLAHTNSIGYVGDGQGGITFWYGSWHGGTNFNEAEIKLEGANGTSYTTTITQFNLLQSTTPAGLIPGTNYFTSDGTQLVPYGDPNGGGDSYTWQGLTFSGLSAGDYTFTYIPLGDPQSYCTSCTPTLDWVPMDQVIRSATVTLSATLLSGDANQNGILDIYEFGTVQQPSTPTLVSSTTNPYSVSAVTTITDTPSEADGTQTVTRNTQVDTTTTYATVDTYSDNSTTTTYSSSTATTNSTNTYTGRIDQYQVLDKVGRTLRGALNHTPSQTKENVRVFSKNYLGWAHGDYGYYGTSTIIGTGVEVDVKPTWTIGGQYNNVSIDLTGADSTSSLSKEHFGVFSMMRGNTLSLRTNGGFALNKYSVSRNVAGVFNNDSTANGQEWWVNNRLYWHAHKNITPFVGHTVSGVKRDGFIENGSVQSARNVGEYNKTENVGEVGVNISHRFGGKKNDKFGVALEASVDTNVDAEFIASVDYNQTIFIEGLHQITDGVNNTQVAAKVKFRF
jgi:hypothetical protein